MQENLDVEWDTAAGAFEPQSNGIRRSVWSRDEAYLLMQGKLATAHLKRGSGAKATPET